MASMSRRIALTAPALITLPTLTFASPRHDGEGPDAELIQLCAAYTKAIDKYNADGGHLDCEVDPLWHAVELLEAQLAGLAATTSAGLIAKASVARRLARKPDGSENYCTSMTGDWPEQVILDLLAMAKRGQA
ncbi:hypothetical protein [Roseomonas haemaphysalidis]|uniref:Twin-arginine translocation pathway signal n=1 Tax=Roseomonas haemaphysalidis TaxID=2768162 RepID=A0ABS3KWJ3_9PROT|nr:hypothetical protein [Roseomonas haemaphysalidis]MBO1081841.1 hypothetical protein [Roseomonas haemaphysalidis]